MKTSLYATADLQEAHVWIVSIAAGLLLVLLCGGLCVTIVLMCNAVDRPELRRDKIGGELLHQENFVQADEASAHADPESQPQQAVVTQSAVARSSPPVDVAAWTVPS